MTDKHKIGSEEVRGGSKRQEKRQETQANLPGSSGAVQGATNDCGIITGYPVHLFVFCLQQQHMNHLRFTGWKGSLTLTMSFLYDSKNK